MNRVRKFRSILLTGNTLDEKVKNKAMGKINSANTHPPKPRRTLISTGQVKALKDAYYVL
jgi:hypothetical protein